MGRNSSHTQEQVFEAADLLAAAGREVTPTTLREHLGGGSLTTLYKHHAAWLEKRAAQPKAVVIEMPDSVKMAMTALWQTAANEAGREIAAIREKSDAEVAAARRRLDEAVASIAQLEGEVEAESARADDLSQRLEQVQEQARAQASEAAAKTAALAATVQQLEVQLRRAHGEIDEVRRVSASNEARGKQLDAEVHRLTENLDRARQDEAAARTELAMCSGLREAAERSGRETAEELRRVQAAVSTLTGELAELRAQAAEAGAGFARAAKELDAERKARQDAEVAAGRLAGELDALRATLAKFAPEGVKGKDKGKS